MATVPAFARRLARRVYVPLLVVVLIGIGLRALTIGVYSTVVTDYFTGDAARYIRADLGGTRLDGQRSTGSHHRPPPGRDVESNKDLR